jgi:hypothetical protein
MMGEIEILQKDFVTTAHGKKWHLPWDAEKAAPLEVEA